MDLAGTVSSVPDRRNIFRSSISRVSPRQPPSPDPLGLQLIANPPSPTADIIFIHGLGGSAFRTWSWQRNRDNFWPRWLVHDEQLQHCRIFTFGYDANFKGKARGLDVVDFAKDLLLQMLHHPDALGNNRPIFFVAHSMGGLVAKKAYLLGKQDMTFAGLIASVMGIVFLATPHRGSHYAKTLGNILAIAPIPPKAYVSALERQSSVLQDINDVFGRDCDDLKLVSFHETLPARIGIIRLIIVEKDSAILGYDNELSASMNADHNTISKYENELDPNYIKLRDTLKMLLPKDTTTKTISRLNAENARKAQEILGVYDFTRDTTYKRHVPQDSGTWLLQQTGFATWLQATESASDPRFYWLFGLPGSGKTTLSNIIVDQLQQRNQSPQFHFFSEAHQTKRTIAYGLRSIVAQLASGDNTFCRALLSLHEETGLYFDNQSQSFHVIWEKVFEGIIFQMRFPRPLIWVLDGIDESDAPDTLLAHLSRTRSLTPVKIFFSSRPINAISRFESAHIRSYFIHEENTADDIRNFATRILRHSLPNNGQLLDDIVRQMMKNSSGSFLWAKLALEALRDNWHTHKDIEAILTALPSGMIPMYERMISRIESQVPRSRNLAQRILTWATCSWRPLSLEELQVALEPEFGNFSDVGDTVTQICGHFIHVPPLSGPRKQISLIHQTARDFLCRGDITTGVLPFINLEDGHHHLALVCLRYLSSDHWRRHFDTIHACFPIPPGGTSNRLLLAERDYPLLGYAACYWSYHVSKAPVDSPDLLQLLQTFLTKHLLSWVEAICFSGNLQHLIHTAQHLKTYARRHLKAQVNTPRASTKRPEHSGDWIHKWAIDITRITGKFGSGLISDPPSVYRQLPVFCPNNSMIGQTYTVSEYDSLTVTGLENEEWDDCVASVNIGTDDYATQVLATDSYFVTLVSTTGNIIVWSAETCEQLRVIKVGNYIPRMAMNRAGTAVAIVTFVSYSVWDLSTGRQLYHCAKSGDALVLDMRFGSTDWELVVAFNSNKIVRINLETDVSDEHTITLPVDSDVWYSGCPWRMALSPDLTKVAAAWRGRPPLVWDLLPTGTANRPRRCLVSSGSSDSICAPEILRWHPNSEVLFVLCQDMNLVEWRILEHKQKEWNLLHAREVTISEDGATLISSDSAGTISIWSLPRLNLMYQLVNESGPSDGMAFSPVGHRFYDIRGSFCNVWEPDALVRADEQDTEERSGVGETTLLIEPTISHFGGGGQLITTLALDATDRYYCCGREDGKVWIHDALSGKRLRKVYSHWASSTVISLIWSESGEYMVSCDDGSFVIAKRLRVMTDGIWAVIPVFDRRLGEPVSQFLFSPEEQYLLISTPTADYVWDLKAKDEVTKHRRPECQSGRWIQHPGESDILVWISPDEVRCHKWPMLDVVANSMPPLPDSPPPPSQSSHDISYSASDPRRHGEKRRSVLWATPTLDKQSIIYTTLPDDGTIPPSRHSHLQIESIDATTILRETGDRQCIKKHCVPGVARQVKCLLGMYKTSMVFLDHECWVCTWNTLDETGQVVRHFFIPKDWLNTSTSHMMAVNAHGTLFCPRYAEVGIVRNGIRV